MRLGFVPGVLGLGAALVGCSGECLHLPCPLPPPALTLQLRDGVDGRAITDGAINGHPCQISEGCMVLSPSGVMFGAGLVLADVTAPGYQPSHLEVVVPSAAVEGCSCGAAYVPQTRTVALTHL
ncbi:MAG TPA: hypothetical protein VLQ79_06080 [Myxococcaceae bacterium]|nr:hypothetical protein [Myxococcaceae bacterium]